MTQVDFSVRPLAGHRFAVRAVCRWEKVRLDFSLPIWIPGSYTRRDFARNLYGIRVMVNDTPVEVVMRSPSQWSASASQGGVWTIEYEVYGREYSVRGCYLDDVRAMFNPCCACVMVDGLETAVQTLRWLPDDSRKDWTVHGALAENGVFQFADYQTLIDTPLMMGEAVRTAVFEVAGVAHEIAVTGDAGKEWDFARLSADVAKVCHEAVAMFGGFPEAVQRYSFLLFLTENGYGGLEHQCSTMLMASRKGLPYADEFSRSYLQLLGLFSHEYFHLWNVKSMRPAQYHAGYRLDSEQPTEMLWLFEGFTAYFDNLLLCRSGVISPKMYCYLLTVDISRYLQRSGRMWQSLAESSFEAWTKLYNGGENAANASISYYIHGSLAAWCLDMFLRKYSDDAMSLGALMPLLWRDAEVREKGLDETRFIAIAQRHLPPVVDVQFTNFVRVLVHGREALPLAEVAAWAGLRLQFLPQASADDLGSEASSRASSELGIRYREEAGRFFVRLIEADNAATQAGVAADDEIIAIDGLRATAETLWQQGFSNQAGQMVSLTVLRDGLLREYRFALMPARHWTCWLSIDEQADNLAQVRRGQWLNQMQENDE